MISLILNVAIAVLTVYSWLSLMFGWGNSGALLADRGIRCLRYFTVLSNLFSGIVALICVVHYLALGAAFPTWLLTLKLVSETTVMLTFAVVILVLVPAYDLKSMYMGSNLWMHLILPLFAAIDCSFFVPVGTLPWQTAFYALLPVILYGLFYLSNILRHGAEENGVTYDFYHLLRWGKDKILLVFILFLANTWLLASILRGASNLLCA